MRRQGRWWVAGAAALGVLLTARLGWWQLDRADQKLALQSRMAARAELVTLDGSQLAQSAADADGQLYRQVQLQGRWLAEHTVFLDNRQMDGRPGFFVVTPLQPASGPAVLVQRGWVPRNFMDRAALPEVVSAQGLVALLGRVAPPPAKLFDFGGTELGRIRQNLELAAFSRETGLAFRPLSVQQLEPERPATPPPGADGTRHLPTAGSSLQRRWPAPAVDIGKHHGYAFQWFALCALITGLYVWFQLIPSRRR